MECNNSERGVAAPLTEEALLGIRRALSAEIHLQAVLQLTQQLRQTPGGPEFLAQWAEAQRQKAETATAPDVGALASQVLGDEYRDVVSQMLQQLGL